MKKLNGKGFMLVEVIIVTVVVVSVMTSLYVVFNRVYKMYEIKNKYSNIDGIYALSLIRDELTDAMFFNSSDFLEISDSSYKNVTSSDCGGDETNNFCTAIFESYNINKVIIVRGDFFVTMDDTAISNLDLNSTFKDYIIYLKNIDISRIETFFFLVEVCVDDANDVYNYAYLPLSFVRIAPQ